MGDLGMFCRDCKYDLRGLTVNRCPECGRESDPGDALSYVLSPLPWWRQDTYDRASSLCIIAAFVCLGDFLVGAVFLDAGVRDGLSIVLLFLAASVNQWRRRAIIAALVIVGISGMTHVFGLATVLLAPERIVVHSAPVGLGGRIGVSIWCVVAAAYMGFVVYALLSPRRRSRAG